eukprot:6104720-Prymnesium_polylepis.1
MGDRERQRGVAGRVPETAHRPKPNLSTADSAGPLRGLGCRDLSPYVYAYGDRVIGSTGRVPM